MPLERLIEQPRARRVIECMVRENRLPHALLFWGPQGVGKSAAAIELARWLNCDRELEGPCGACDSCIRFRALEHPHFSYQMPLPGKALVDSEGGELTQAGAALLADILKAKGEDPYRPADFPGGQFILIGQIRFLVQWASKRAFIDKPRLALIDGADRLREEAGNALLKLLEEPPANFILVLTAETPEDLLPTLQSRCHSVEFDRLRPEVIERELRARGFDEERSIRRIAHLCGGNFTRALEFVAQPERATQLHNLAINLVRHALSKSPLELDHLLETWVKLGPTDQRLTLEIIATWMRDAAVIQAIEGTGEAEVINVDHRDLLKKFVANCPRADFTSATEQVEEARRNLEGNALPPLTLLSLARHLYCDIYQHKPV